MAPADTAACSLPTSLTRFFGTDDQRFEAVIVLEDARQGGRHQRLAQAHHVADQHAAALVEMVGGDLDGGHLEFEELVSEVAWNVEIPADPRGLLRER